MGALTQKNSPRTYSVVGINAAYSHLRHATPVLTHILSTTAPIKSSCQQDDIAHLSLANNIIVLYLPDALDTIWASPYNLGKGEASSRIPDEGSGGTNDRGESDRYR